MDTHEAPDFGGLHKSVNCEFALVTRGGMIKTCFSFSHFFNNRKLDV